MPYPPGDHYPVEDRALDYRGKEDFLQTIFGRLALGVHIKGTWLREQEFGHQGEVRYYFLYIPDSYNPSNAVPLLVDLHGTATFKPEEAYGLEDAVEAAEEYGFILLRPRSRFSMEGGYRIYRWDQNPGDPERNNDFIKQLSCEVSGAYHIDENRVYLMGFSSGTNQTAVAMSDDETPFKGFGFIGGGAWRVNEIETVEGNVYMATGFRDYMKIYYYTLLNLLNQAGIDPDQLFIRETDAGHDLYGWIYAELFPFLDTGQEPAMGELVPGWSRESFPEMTDLLAVTRNNSGEILTIGEENGLFRRSISGEWDQIEISDNSGFTQYAFTSICMSDDGYGFAVGDGQFAISTDGGATWSHQGRIPELGPPVFGFEYFIGIKCSTEDVIGIGYWQGAGSEDRGFTWEDIFFETGYGGRAQGAAVAVSEQGTWLSAGYYRYLGRSEDGHVFGVADIPYQAQCEWFYDVEPLENQTWIAVGDNGIIIRSEDDGMSFQCVKCDGGNEFYAVAFSDDRGIAVGRGGAAYYSEDGGKVWRDVSCGLNIYLGDAVWLNDGTALVVGEEGNVLIFDPEGLDGQLLYFPRLSYVPGRSTEGFGLVNTGPNNAAVAFIARDSLGNEVGSSGLMDWGVGCQEAYQAEEILGLNQATNAWVTVQSNSMGIMGLFLSQMNDQKALVAMDGAAVFTESLTEGIFPRVRGTGGYTTEIFIANLEQTSADVTFTGYDGGNIIPGGTRTIAARGLLITTMTELFGPEGVFDGYLHLESTRGVIGNAAIRFGNASLSSVNVMPLSQSSKTLYASHIALWPDLYYTQINLINTSDTNATVFLSPYNADGTLMIDSFTVVIPPRQVLTLEDAELGLQAGDNCDGWLKIESPDHPLMGCVTFGNPLDNRYETTLPLQAAGASDIYFPQVANGDAGGVDYSTGIAIVNPSADTPVEITLTVHKSNGDINGNVILRTLQPREKYVRELKEINGIGALENQSSGYLHIMAEGPVLSFQLFYNKMFTFLSAVPAQYKIESPAP